MALRSERRLPSLAGKPGNSVTPSKVPRNKLFGNTTTPKRTAGRKCLQDGAKLDNIAIEPTISNSSQIHQNENKDVRTPTPSTSGKPKAWPLPLLRKEKNNSKIQPLSKKNSNSNKKLKNRKNVDPKQPTVKALIESYNKKAEEEQEESLNQDKQERIAVATRPSYSSVVLNTTTSSTEGAKQTSENIPSVPCETRTRTTVNFLRKYRREKWEERMKWVEDDIDRKIDSKDALPEDLQDRSSPMVVVGSDVVSLFPSLDVEQVAAKVKDAVIASKIKWDEIDYLEGARYLALNWTAEECRTSKLRRVLPTRRKTCGTRPGLRGAGPRGKTRGTQEQWSFPNITLEDWEKTEIIAENISLATNAMFKYHFYSFDGKTQGGPNRGKRHVCHCKTGDEPI